MGFYNRPYLKDGNGGMGEGSSGGGLAQIGLAKPTPAVLWIMAICAAMFILTAVVGRRIMYDALALSLSASPEIWRFVTFQFMHAGPGHIIFNMIGLYFFGPPLERTWGAKRFLVFYLTCGVFAGVCFDVLAAVMSLPNATLVGASGGILGLLAGCAIMMPSMMVFFVPIRIATALFGALYMLSILMGQNMGDAAHLGGMIMAGVWIWGQSRLRVGRIGKSGRIAGKLNSGAWNRKMQARLKVQAEVDRVLKKIHDEGITSLTRKERKILQDASGRQQEEDRRIKRM